MSATSVRPRVLPPGLLPASGFYRLSVGEYHAMIRAGILTPEDRVELLDGYLVAKMPQNPPHSSTVGRLTEDLARLVPAGWRLRIQLPVTLTAGENEPEPDAALVRGDRRAFDARNPTPADFGVVFEVADTSLVSDRRAKGILYASSGIPVYWIVNIPDAQVEVYTDPDPAATPPAYRTRADYRAGQGVPVVLGGQVVGTVAASDLLP